MPNLKPRVLMDIVTGCSIALFSVVFLQIVVPVAIELPIDISHYALSPRFLPSILATMAGLFGICIIARAVSCQLDMENAPTAADSSSSATGKWKALTAFIFFWLVAWSVPFAGLTLACGTAASGLMLLSGERSLWAYLLVAIAIPFTASWIFLNFLHVPIPSGPMFNG